MKKKQITFLGIFLLGMSFVLPLYPQAGSQGELMELAKVKSGVKNRRISSTDQTGGNRDHLEPFEPGEKRTIAQINGTGIINHIWITISPPPGELSLSLIHI